MGALSTPLTHPSYPPHHNPDSSHGNADLKQRFNASTADYQDSKEDFETMQELTTKALDRTTQIWTVWKSRSDDIKVHRRHSWAIAQEIIQSKERFRLEKDDLKRVQCQDLLFGHLFAIRMAYDQQRRMQRAIDKLALQYSGESESQL